MSHGDFIMIDFFFFFLLLFDSNVHESFVELKHIGLPCYIHLKVIGLTKRTERGKENLRRTFGSNQESLATNLIVSTCAWNGCKPRILYYDRYGTLRPRLHDIEPIKYYDTR